jgi:hypothetical protein
MRKKLKTFEVQLVIESTSTYYIEAEGADEAREKAEERFLEGAEDENPSCGWCSVSHTNINEMVPVKAKKGVRK